MANTFYITAGLTAIDYAVSPPTGDNIFLITAGLVANDYVVAGGTNYPRSVEGSLVWGGGTTVRKGTLKRNQVGAI